MTDKDTASAPVDRLSETLIERIDSLDIPELRAVLSYAEARIESLRTPLEEDIEASAAGEILEIENHGGYALVRMHPPAPDGSTVDSSIISLYHVRREQRLDGEESLHWAYLGDVNATEQNRCQTCGRPISDDSVGCPHCEGGVNDPTKEGS